MANFKAVIDMGSNGIRFSISDISERTARILPTVYSDRLGLSLYDAQWINGEKRPIPEDVIQQVVKAFLRFKVICSDFDVDEQNIQVLATEATRVAINSEDFLSAIKQSTGWSVRLLSKQDEGDYGAFGIASSFHQVRGLCMDLGGGSTQMSWICAREGEVLKSESAVSLPYGAAALTHNPPERSVIISKLREAYESLNLPIELKKDLSQGRLNLYLSGGGFRGWGFALMDNHPQNPYPIPVINGFNVPAEMFHDTQTIAAAVRAKSENSKLLKMHRLSKRRISQIPAVANLVSCVGEAVPKLHNIYFCQGGVREGALFASLPHEIRQQHPLAVATKLAPNALSDASASAVCELLRAAAPHTSRPLQASGFVEALARSMFLHASLSKDVNAACALQSTITGALAGAHGLSHEDRAALAVGLCERYGGRKALDPINTDLYDRLKAISTDLWALRYFGRVAALIAAIYPAGNISTYKRVQFRRDWDGSRLHVVVELKQNALTDCDSIQETVEWIQKLGKAKHWKDGLGHKLDWQVQRVNQLER
ncbi:Ppx/GppA phosphatase family-domain-containing protein [Phyllosticta citribraziliensis]|uniref:Ppx/GppA phosphatase family-domain-containing protein n=1 Tax=Phyllosticta citribraziliensis TaxID=989973 RepID=A0ABR1LCR7_9PEZI